MAYLSIREAARRLGKDERTVRRWIENGTMAAAQAANGRLVVNEMEIARVQALAPEQPAENSLAQRVKDLEERVARLEQAQARTSAPVYKQIAAPARPRVSDPAEQRPMPRLELVTPGKKSYRLPGDLVVASWYAEAHGINKGTAKSAFQAGRVPVVAGTWRVPGERNPIRSALDAAGRARFHEIYQDNPGFQHSAECDVCAP